jgi:hypothetical protein
MHRFATSYAGWFNRRHDRVGHLFQDRFGSRLATDDADIVTLIRYVHANPLRAGLVASIHRLAEYPWCGHGALLGRRSPAAFHDVAAVIALLGGDVEQARATLLESMAAGMEACLIGESESRSALVKVRDGVCAELGIDPQDLARGIRGPVAAHARERITLRATTELGADLDEIAVLVGARRDTLARLRRRGFGV